MDFMPQEIQSVLKRMEREDAEDRNIEDRPREDRMFTLHPDTSVLIHMMIQCANCKNLVEVGVAHGYSTVWLAHAAKLTGGRLTSFEINPRAIEIAQRNLAETGLTDLVEFVEGDALETVKSYEGPFDFVLMDCWEWLYVDLMDIIVPRLRPGGMIVADNVSPGGEESDRFIKTLHEHPAMETVSVPIGREIEVCVKMLGGE